MPITFTAATEVPADVELLAVPVFKGGEIPGDLPVEIDKDFLTLRGFRGGVGETLPLLADDGGVVLVVGVGERSKVTADVLRRAGAAVTRNAGAATRAAVSLLAAVDGGDRRSAAQALTEGLALASYSFDSLRSEHYEPKARRCTLTDVTVVGDRDDAEAVTAGVERGSLVASAVLLARDLINEPAAGKTPRRLEEVAASIAEKEGLDLTVYGPAELLAGGYGGVLGVAAGSDEEPRLIQLTHSPANPVATVALVGKGITFDSGGLSIKTGEGMMTMKTDMSGGAAVLAAMAVVKRVAPDVKVIGIVPATENMPSGKAVKPGDVLRIRNGKTVEVLNTDAEGRLVLADGLSLAVEQGPDVVVDIATLTGAQVVALGKKIAGLMTNDDDVRDRVQAAADRAGEMVWPLPLADVYRDHIDSEVADIKNIGVAGQAGTIIAGLFLREFVGDVPWAHLDIAGPARADKDEHHLSQGGTAFGTRTLIELVASYQPAG